MGVRRGSRLALAIGAGFLAAACQPRESLEVTRARAQEAILLTQIADLKGLNARADAGDVVTEGRIAIGIAEETSAALLQISLPQEKVLGDRVLVRIESAQAFFRGNNAVLLFQATAHMVGGTAQARLEMAGRLKDFSIDAGRLVSGIEIVHFKVLDSSLGELGTEVLEGLIRDNLSSLSGVLPGLEIPVKLEESIPIAGLSEGVVTVKPGALPLRMTLSEVLPVNQRLWVLIEVKAGPWQKLEPAGKRP
jgi:hypothetical protein